MGELDYSFIITVNETLVSFAVMGGIYSEGIDLKGDRLSGAIVVGVSVLQSAGRVIRTEKDKGVVCLIDERFSYSGYKKIFPPHLRSNVKIRRIEDMNKLLDLFWK